MTKIAKKWQIKLIDSFKIDDDHVVELSHNNDKTEYFVEVKADFYTEFTFSSRQNARECYNVIKKSTNVYMDSLLIGAPTFKEEPVNSNYKMSESEISAYKEGR